MRSEERQTETDNAALSNENTDTSSAFRKEGYESQTKCPGTIKGGCNADSLLGRLTIDGLPGKPEANPRDAEGRAEGTREGSDSGRDPALGAGGDINNERNGKPQAELGRKAEPAEDEAEQHGKREASDEEEENAEHDEKPEAENGEEEDDEPEEEHEDEHEGRGDHGHDEEDDGQPEAHDGNENGAENEDTETREASNSEKTMAGEMAKLAHAGEGMKHASLKEQEQNSEEEPPIDDPEDNPDGTAPDQPKDQRDSLEAKKSSNTKSDELTDKQQPKEVASKGNSSDCLKIDPGDLQLTPYPESKLLAIKERSLNEVMAALKQAGENVRNQFHALPLNKDGIGYGQQHIVFLRQQGLNDAAQSMSTHIAALGRIAYGQSMFESPPPHVGTQRKPPVDSSTRTWTLPEPKPAIIQYKRI